MCMKKMKFLLVLACMAIHSVASATDDLSDVLLSLVEIKPNLATEEQVTTLLGKPDRTEESKKQSVWYYNMNQNNLVVYWSNRDAKLERYSFTTAQVVKKALWDSRLARSLKMGQTNIAQAIKTLGTPKEMMVREVNQELHY